MIPIYLLHLKHATRGMATIAQLFWVDWTKHGSTNQYIPDTAGTAPQRQRYLPAFFSRLIGEV
jgi:hypothetical protein